jgi:hypothetical protein
MNESHLNLTTEERTFLVALLERTLQTTRVEEHRTRAPTYREYVVRDEELMASVLNKLGKPAALATAQAP